MRNANTSAILALANGMESGAIDPRRLVEQTLTAIGQTDPAIFTLVTADRARREASGCAERRSHGHVIGPLDGVPIAWKDLFDLEGFVTKAGSRVLDDGPAKADAPVVSALAAAGMVTVGRVNMTEFAYSGIGLNPHYGTPINPHGLTPRVPGGSSSGSAVAVARGLTPAAIGTDTGGSVRIPAAFTGVVGYKSSAGRYPMSGAFPLSRTLDTLGVFAGAVADAILVDAAMRGVTPTLPAPAIVDGLRIFAPTNVVLYDCEAEVLANFEASLAALKAAGVVIERKPFPIFDEIMALHKVFGTLAAHEAYALHRERIEAGAAAQMDRRVVARILSASKLDPNGLPKLLEARRDLIARAIAACGDGFVAYPTVAHVAPSIAAIEEDDEAFVQMNAKTLRNTMLGNMLNWCGVSLPNGFGFEAMPTGFLLSGMPGDDDRLLAAALAIEEIFVSRAAPVQFSTRK
jgi:aspartyl-tRNA(Asn)/glutamyl-tRNA(Gln) amidotransferase subunit A